MEPYTVAITSCGRFDLLERTLSSLLPFLEGPLERIIIVEDSGSKQVEIVAEKFSDPRMPIETIVNEIPLGQVGSIDRLYSQINTEWIFHCEDDWEFISGGFISDSFKIMNEFDSCSMVSCRGRNSFSSSSFLPIAVANNGLSYFVANATSNWKFAGLHFNPGLRRMRDYQIVGPYSDLRVTVGEIGESRIARVYADLGYRVICFENPHIRHIGNCRHVEDHKQRVTGYKRQLRYLFKPFESTYLKLFPSIDPTNEVRHRFENYRANFVRWHDWDDE